MLAARYKYLRNGYWAVLLLLIISTAGITIWHLVFNTEPTLQLARGLAWGIPFFIGLYGIASMDILYVMKYRAKENTLKHLRPETIGNIALTWTSILLLATIGATYSILKSATELRMIYVIGEIIALGPCYGIYKDAQTLRQQEKNQH